MSRLTSLPDEVLKLVMQHVPLKARLTKCCLVNSKLHAAAVAATQELGLGTYFLVPSANDIHVTSPSGARSALKWLDHHGHHLTSLRVHRIVGPVHQLHSPNLLQLYLVHMCSVQLGTAADGSPGVVHSCSKLTRLELQWCGVIDAPGGNVVVDCLSSLVHLQHLDWWPDGEATLSAATLPCLDCLTFLHIAQPTGDHLQQLSGLTKLQDVCLADGAVALGPSSVPGFTFPASLTKLELLSRVEVGVLSLVPATLRHLELSGSFVDAMAVEGPGSFPSCLGRLQQLTTLVVFIEPQSFTDWPPPSPAYAALTASNNLVELSIECELPDGIWPFVFPVRCKLPHLTSLSLMAEGPYKDPAPMVWGPADVASLVSCCPNLCVADKLYLQKGAHVSQLQQLTALTRVDMIFGADGGLAAEQCMRGLAGVTQLRCLDLCVYIYGRSVASLLPLTSLSLLTKLDYTGYASNDLGEGSNDNDVSLVLRQEGPGPDVWLQLLERCAAVEPTCQPTALRSLAQQLAEQRALTAQQQQQLTAQQQQSVMQQQQMSAQREVVAAQGTQIAGLQGQLQAMQAQLQQLLQRQQQ